MTRKPHKFGHAEDIIREYPENVRQLAQRRNDIIYGTAPKPEVMISGKGRNGDTTASRAFKLIQDPHIQYLKDSVYSVESAISTFANDPRYEQIIRIIELFYWRQTHTIIGAAQEVGYSERQARNIKQLFVRRVLEFLGW